MTDHQEAEYLPGFGFYRNTQAARIRLGTTCGDLLHQIDRMYPAQGAEEVDKVVQVRICGKCGVHNPGFNELPKIAFQ